MQEKEQTDSMHFTWGMVESVEKGRANLGQEMPVSVFRLYEYTLRDTLFREYGHDECIRLLRKCGTLAGREFCQHALDTSLPMGHFISQLQQKLKEMKIGILRMESFDDLTGEAVLSVNEDLDCSGMSDTGETVCNYDEGFIGGIFSCYTGKPYIARETECWARGDRCCRFHVSVCS